MTAPWFLERFRRAIGHDGQWRADCPHCGAGRALSIGDGTKRGDTYVVNCFAGCDSRTVLATVGLTLSDLLYESTANGVYISGGTEPSSPRSLSHERRDSRSDEGESAEVDALLASFKRGNVTREELPRVALPMFTAESPPMRRVADFYALVWALRLWAGMPAPERVPFATRWVARHTRLHRMTASRALRGLVEAGVLERGTAMPGRGGRRGTAVYLPGRSACDEEFADRVVIEAERDRHAPDPERRVVEHGRERVDVVPVLEAPSVVPRGLSALVSRASCAALPHAADSSLGSGGTEASAERLERVHGEDRCTRNGGGRCSS